MIAVLKGTEIAKEYIIEAMALCKNMNLREEDASISSIAALIYQIDKDLMTGDVTSLALRQRSAGDLS